MTKLPRLAALAALVLLPACAHDGITTVSAGPRAHRIRMHCASPVGQEGVLYVVNGERTSRERLEEIDPARITSVEILKGERAIATYGPDAGKGVIVMRADLPAAPR